MRLSAFANNTFMFSNHALVILPNSPGADILTPAEVERRTNSFNARRALLKSNPSLYISKTRLSVRQIPTFVTERMLRRLALHSVKSFNSEVKQGIRDPLSADELADVSTSKPGDDFGVDDDRSDEKKEKGHGKKRGVRQAKIVRQADRIDPISGKGKSKGYGFVEMYRHSDALKFLRWTNNNPEVGELFSSVWWKEELEALLKAEEVKDETERDDAKLKRLKAEIERLEDGDAKRKSKGTLIVEFSIENVQVVQRRNTKQQDNKEKAMVCASTAQLSGWGGAQYYIRKIRIRGLQELKRGKGNLVLKPKILESTKVHRQKNDLSFHKQNLLNQRSLQTQSVRLLAENAKNARRERKAEYRCRSNALLACGSS